MINIEEINTVRNRMKSYTICQEDLNHFLLGKVEELTNEVNRLKDGLSQKDKELKNDRGQTSEVVGR